MECDVCKQDNASIFLTQVVEGKVRKVNLCNACAEEKGVTDPTGYDLAEMLKGMGEHSVQKKSSRGTSCPNCGFSQADFKKTGRMGCSVCYDVFTDGLEGLLKAMHKGTRHCGKVPKGLLPEKQKEDQIEALQRQLSASIENEDYEEAAKIRDQLRQLEAEAVQSDSDS